MANTVDNFNVSFGADFKELLAEMRKAEQATSKFRQGVAKDMDGARQAVERIGNQIISGLTRLAAGFGLAGLTRMGREAMKTAEELEQTSKWLGVGVERLQAWEFAAREAGLEQGRLTAGLDKMRGNLADFAADPSSNGALIFRQLGISLRDSAGQLRTLDSIIPELARKISTLGTGDKLLVGKLLFGDKNDDVVRFFGSIAGRFQEVEQRAKDAGQVFSKDFVEKVAPLNREIELLENRIGKDLKKAVIDFAPAWKIALAAVIEVQEAVDGLLSRVRIGGARLGTNRSATERLGELDRDIADSERRLAERNGQGTGLDRLRRLSPSERQATEQDLARYRAQRAAITDQVDAEAAARQRPASFLEQESMLAGITVNPTGTKPDHLRVGGEDEFTKKIRDMEREAAALLDELDFGRATASLNKLLAEFEAGNGKIVPTRVQVEKFEQALRLRQSREGLVALKDMREEAIANAEAAQLEAAGEREAAEALRMRFELARRYGPEFAASQEQWIQQLARYKIAMADLSERTRSAMQGLEQTGRDVFAAMTGDLNDFFDKNLRGWDLVRTRAVNVLNVIANKLQELAVNDLFRALGFKNNGPGVGDFLSAAGTIIGSIFGGAVSTGGTAGIEGLVAGGLAGRAEGGPVMAGTPYLIGERGPELYVPNMSGTIVPNRALASGGTVNLYGSDSATIEIGQLKAGLRQLGIRVNQVDQSIDHRAVGAVIDARRRGGSAGRALE